MSNVGGIKVSVSMTVSEGGLVREGFGDFNGQVTLNELLDFTKQSLILTANEVLREEQANGFDKNPVVIVDGRTNKPVIDVKPFGTIDFVMRTDVGDMLQDVYQSLLDKSPVLTGAYKASHQVYWNKKIVATDLPSLLTWIQGSPAIQDGDIIGFVDIQPYARKLERLGVTAQRTKPRTAKRGGTEKRPRVSTFVAPNGVYYLTYRSILSKYGKNATIRFDFIPGNQLYNTSGTFARRRGKPGRPYLYPAILIQIKASGVF